MSPRVLKRPRMSAATVRFEPPSPRPAREGKRLPESGEDKTRQAATLRKEIETEAAARWERERAVLITGINETVARALAASEPDLVRLAVRVAARVCREGGARSPESVTAWVREGLTVIGEGIVRTVRVHTESAEAVRAMAEGGREDVRVVADPALEPGDVVVDGGNATYDARVATRLEEVERTFTRLSGEKA